jgi:integrase
MADAIIMLLLNTGLRVNELVTLTWERVHLQARSGWIDVVGKGDKHRQLPLNVEARKALEVIQPTPVNDAVFRGKRGAYRGAWARSRGVRGAMTAMRRESFASCRS